MNINKATGKKREELIKEYYYNRSLAISYMSQLGIRQQDGNYLYGSNYTQKVFKRLL